MNGPELFAVQLQLAPLKPYGAQKAGGYQAYGVVLRLLEAADPVLAGKIHAEDAAKPLTVGPPVWRRDSGLQGEQVTIRITALRPQVYDALARAVVEAGDCPLELGTTPLKVVELDHRPRRRSITGTATFESLFDNGEVGGSALPCLRLLTPTTFRSGGVNVTFPTADLVFGSLIRRWNAFAPFAVPEEVARDLKAQLVPVAFALRTRQVDFGSYQQTGFIGFCRYEALRGLSEQGLQWAATLIRFATFAGVGAKTTMGMGQTRADDTGAQR